MHEIFGCFFFICLFIFLMKKHQKLAKQTKIDTKPCGLFTYHSKNEILVHKSRAKNECR